MKLDKLSFKILEAVNKTKNSEDKWTKFIENIGQYSSKNIEYCINLLIEENYIRVSKYDARNRTFADPEYSVYLELTSFGRKLLHKRSLKYKFASVLKVMGNFIISFIKELISGILIAVLVAIIVAYFGIKQ